MHIVEDLIAERAPRLISRPRFFKLIKPLLYRMLGYDDAVRLADKIQPLTGEKAFSSVSDYIAPKLDIKGLSYIPKTGRCIIIANHPTGLSDGIAVFQAIRHRRPDHHYLANSDALRVIPLGEDIIIPVEWVEAKRNHSKMRDTLLTVKAILEDERCIVIFPSGALASLTWRGLVDQPWQSSAAMLARKYNAPLIPLQIKARNSWLYYLFAKLNVELRDITLFYELLNKRGKLFKLGFGEAIQPDSLSKNAEDATVIIRKIVEQI